MRMCMFHVESEKQSLENFIEKTKIIIYNSYNKGEKSKIGLNKEYYSYGFSCVISDKEWNDFEGQINDIVFFLEKNYEELKDLRDNYNISDWRFDIPYYCRLNEEIFCQCDYLPPKLLSLVGKLGIGIELSQYWDD